MVFAISNFNPEAKTHIGQKGQIVLKAFEIFANSEWQNRIFGGKVKIAQKLLRFLQNLSGKIANQIRKKGQIVSKTFDFVIK